MVNLWLPWEPDFIIIIIIIIIICSKTRVNFCHFCDKLCYEFARLSLAAIGYKKY